MRASVRAALVAAAVATSVVGASSVASAACPSGYMCGWGDRNYLTAGNGNAYVKAAACRPNLNNINYEGTARESDNDITSVFNNGNVSNSYYYTAASYGGSALYIARGTGKSQLNATDPTFDNTITSFKFIGSC